MFTLPDPPPPVSLHALGDGRVAIVTVAVLPGNVAAVLGRDLTRMGEQLGIEGVLRLPTELEDAA